MDATREELVSEVMRRAAFASSDDAERLLDATLAVLGERLMRDEATALGGVLGPDLARVVTASGYDRDFDAGELYDRVRLREATGTDAPAAATAREHVHVVLRAIAARLDEGTRRRVVRALPDEIGDLLAAPGPRVFDLPPHGDHHAPPSSVRSLATGRPGSLHPLSEGRLDGAHSQSVARSDDPHGETKLSSARGTTQERRAHTLATGRPPAPERTVAETDDTEGGAS